MPRSVRAAQGERFCPFQLDADPESVIFSHVLELIIVPHSFSFIFNPATSSSMPQRHPGVMFPALSNITDNNPFIEIPEKSIRVQKCEISSAMHH